MKSCGRRIRSPIELPDNLMAATSAMQPAAWNPLAYASGCLNEILREANPFAD
jgi:hypothetical protein